MAFHGSASSNLSPFLFKGNNRPLAINLIIHRAQNTSMPSNLYSNGTFIEALQDYLLSKRIGHRDSLPNLYAYFDYSSRRSTTNFTITNSRGSLLISDGFMKGESTGALTKSNWTSKYLNTSTGRVNVCTDRLNSASNEDGRLNGQSNTQLSQDVHGNLWSIYTTPNAISTATPGKYGRVLDSIVRKGAFNVIITNSNDQENIASDMINNSVQVNSAGTLRRTINGTSGEMNFRKYKVIAVSSYQSGDGFDGVLFFGSNSPQPYGYVNFTSSTTYTITRSTIYPSTWRKFNDQVHDTLTLAAETKGALFEIDEINSSNIVAFARCVADFISNTI